MKNILHGNGSLGRKMQSLFLMTLFVLQSTLSLAQNRTVTGVVVDEKDEPIIGANVTVKKVLPKERLQTWTVNL